MGKLFKKFIGLALGLAIVFGTGVFVNNKCNVAANAVAQGDTTSTISFTSSNSSGVDAQNVTWTVNKEKGGCASGSYLKLYGGAFITNSTAICVDTSSKATIRVGMRKYGGPSSSQATIIACAYDSDGNALSNQVHLEPTTTSNASYGTDDNIVFEENTGNSNVFFRIISSTYATSAKNVGIFSITVIYTAGEMASYNVSFNGNGANGEMEDISTGASLNAPECSFAQPDNKIFIGWKINNAGELILPGAQINLNDDITLYAQWSDLYTVSFNGNGGSEAMESELLAGSYTLPDNGFVSPNGYYFIGWKINNSGELLASGSDIIVNGNISLYAQWNLCQAEYKRSAPKKDKFAIGSAFSYGGTVTVTWNYDTDNPIVYDENSVDENGQKILTFKLSDSNKKFVTNISFGDTVLKEYDGLYVEVYCKGKEEFVGQRYSISVYEGFDKNNGEYHLASTEDIVEGAHIIIAGGYSDNTSINYALGLYTSGNNVPAVDAVKNTTKNIIDKTNAEDIELVAGADEGYFTLKYANGTHLYAAGGDSNNHLKAETSDLNSGIHEFEFNKISDYKWTIKAQANIKKNEIMYNPNNNKPIFSCYSSGQKDVCVYAFVSYKEELKKYENEFLKINDSLDYNPSYIGVPGTNCLDSSKGGNDYYSKAKKAFNKLTEGAQNLFFSDSQFYNARERLVAWANANNESYNQTNHSFEKSRVFSADTFSLEDADSIALITAVAAISSSALLGIYILKKKRKLQ